MVYSCLILLVVASAAWAQDECVTQFNTVGRCLDATVGQMHQQTLDPNTRNAINACFTPYLCTVPNYDAANFGTLPDGLESIGQSMLQRWFALPESKRVCVKQRLYVERKRLIEDCYGGPVPDVGESPLANAKGNAHRQALINVDHAQEACHTKLGGAEVTKTCVANAYKTSNKNNKCLIFQGCAQNIVSPICVSNFQNQYGRYCMCREKAYAESITSVISFSSDLAAFRDVLKSKGVKGIFGDDAPANDASTDSAKPGLVSPAGDAGKSNNPTTSIFGGGLLGSSASNLFSGAATQLSSLFGGANTGGISNILGGSVEQAKSLFSSLLGGTGGGLPTLPGGLTGLPGPGTVNPGQVVGKATSILTDCGIDGAEFTLSAQNTNLARYCGCNEPNLFSPATCYVSCGGRIKTHKDVEQLLMTFQGQIEPRQEESFFCNGCV